MKNIGFMLRRRMESVPTYRVRAGGDFPRGLFVFPGRLCGQGILSLAGGILSLGSSLSGGDVISTSLCESLKDPRRII